MIVNSTLPFIGGLTNNWWGQIACVASQIAILAARPYLEPLRTSDRGIFGYQTENKGSSKESRYYATYQYILRLCQGFTTHR